MRVTHVAAFVIAGRGLQAAVPAQAGNDANFILYNQHVEEKGETEVELFSDFANVGGGEKNYNTGRGRFPDESNTTGQVGATFSLNALDPPPRNRYSSRSRGAGNLTKRVEI